MAPSYQVNGRVEPEEVRTQQMLDNGSFHVAVRDNEQLVGFVRVLTDYVYYGLVTEVAVAPSHKKLGIGKEMLRVARETATPKVTLILTSSEEGAPFYEHLGWERMGRGYRLRRTE
jgi:ribosomal protein S18 acetylase RimI-like enzyme